MSNQIDRDISKPGGRSAALKALQTAVAGLALAAACFGAPCAADAQQNAPAKIEQKDFVKRIDDVRQNIERDRNATRPEATTDRAIVDVCKQNPQLPQCKLN